MGDYGNLEIEVIEFSHEDPITASDSIDSSKTDWTTEEKEIPVSQP